MGSLRNFRLKIIFKRVTPNLAILFIVGALVIYNEVVSFYVSSWQWPKLSPTNSEDVRVLFVADPQLQGLRDEPALLGIITRWDADKYLQFGFFQAVGYVRPDVVIFLGDLLDEGSISSNEEYLTYVRRFRNVFRTPPTAHRVFISGDNDVGGEGSDAKQSWKIDRFRKHFEQRGQGVYAVKHVEFQTVSIDYGEPISQSHIDSLSSMRSDSTGRFRITCNHMPLLSRLPVHFSLVVDNLQPHLIVTAHTHLFRLYRCKECWMQQSSDVKSTKIGQTFDFRNMARPLQFNLSDLSYLYEIVIPTCSYRMGVPDMGYGAAVISRNGKMKFDILWLPSRYSQLAAYVVVLVIAVILFVISNICR